MRKIQQFLCATKVLIIVCWQSVRQVERLYVCLCLINLQQQVTFRIVSRELLHGQQVSLLWPPQCLLDQHNGEEELQLLLI